MRAHIRLAIDSDAEQIQAIYAPIVRDTAISFETEAPSVKEMRERILGKQGHFPWLVCELDHELLGYVYAGSHRERAAYQWSVDVTAYVSAARRRSGVGRALYTSLFRILVLQGFYSAFAGITLPNAGSTGLHTSLGFQPVGVYRNVGYKLGAWHDVSWWYLPLQAPANAPAAPSSSAAVQASPAWEEALSSGLPLLKI